MLGWGSGESFPQWAIATIVLGALLVLVLLVGAVIVFHFFNKKRYKYLLFSFHIIDKLYLSRVRSRYQDNYY